LEFHQHDDEYGQGASRRHHPTCGTMGTSTFATLRGTGGIVAVAVVPLVPTMIVPALVAAIEVLCLVARNVPIGLA